MKKKFTISDDFVNTRLDRWFKKNIYKIPQSLIEKHLRKGNINVNNKKTKSSYKLLNNDEIFVNIPNLKPDTSRKFLHKYVPSSKEINSTSNIFLENNDNFVIINKPPGIAVQSGTKSKKNIIDIISKTEEFKNSTPFTVHRIDKDTSGILLVAKNRKYAQIFTSLFRLRKIKKIYLGIIIGNLGDKKGTLIDELLYYEGNKKIKTKAITNYFVVDSNSNYSFLKLYPQTGRKHQLRKQLYLRGCPILGDDKYRISSNQRSVRNNLMLHAYEIAFTINETKYSHNRASAR